MLFKSGQLQIHLVLLRDSHYFKEGTKNVLNISVPNKYIE